MKVISAQYLPKPSTSGLASTDIIDPHVVLQMYGLKEDQREFQTKTVDDNGTSYYRRVLPACWEFLGIVKQNGVQRTTYLIQKQNNKKQSLAVFRDFLEQEATSSKTKDIFRISMKMRVE